MASWIERVVEQLVGALWRLLAAKVTARLELELAATQAELVAQAAAWRRDHGQLGEAVARRLEGASEKLEMGLSTDLIDRGEASAKPAPRLKSGTGEGTSSSEKRGRGRPKKIVETEIVDEPLRTANENALPFEESRS